MGRPKEPSQPFHTCSDSYSECIRFRHSSDGRDRNIGTARIPKMVGPALVPMVGT